MTGAWDVPSPGRRLRFWRHAELRLLGRRSRQVIVLAAVTGLITGMVVAGFEYLVNEQILARVEAWPLALQACAAGTRLGRAPHWRCATSPTGHHRR